MITGSKELIRDINTTLVLRTIMDEGPISRADISKRLGLTKATISAIVQALLDRNLIEEIGTAQVSMGRKPVLLKFSEGCGYAISVDLSDTQITVLTSHLAGGNCNLRQFSTTNTREEVLPTLINAIETQMKTVPSCPYDVVGISVGIHGVVHKNEIIFTPYSPYSGLDLKKELEDYFHLPVQIENEANLSVLGEYTFHYPKKNIIGLSVHSGIGLGIIIDGKLYSGDNGYAGEFGHSIIEIDGRPCPCGNHGCFEQYASELALLKELSASKGTKDLTMEDFVRLYQKNDPAALSVMDHFIKYMAIGINNILTTLNPDLIVINSSFTMSFPQVIYEIERAISGHTRHLCHMVPSGLQDMSILLGGVCTIRNHFLFIST